MKIMIRVPSKFENNLKMIFEFCGHILQTYFKKNLKLNFNYLRDFFENQL